MFKSWIGAIVCLWAWRKWHGSGAGFTVEGEDVGNAIEKEGSLVPNSVITWDFSYMGPSNNSQNSVVRQQKYP
jgi:hypothetical protein